MSAGVTLGAAEAKMREAVHEAEGIPTTTIETLPAEARLHALDASAEGSDPDLWLYRDRTIAVLKRYLRFSVEVGRLPSLIGREFFRTRAISYQVLTFEDAVILVHDVEKDLARLDPFDQDLIAKCILLEYTQDEAAGLLQCRRRTVNRRLPEALDHLSLLFLESGLLRKTGGARAGRREKLSRGQKGENPGK